MFTYDQVQKFQGMLQSDVHKSSLIACLLDEASDFQEEIYLPRNSPYPEELHICNRILSNQSSECSGHIQFKF